MRIAELTGMMTNLREECLDPRWTRTCIFVKVTALNTKTPAYVEAKAQLPAVTVRPNMLSSGGTSCRPLSVW